MTAVQVGVILELTGILDLLSPRAIHIQNHTPENGEEVHHGPNHFDLRNYFPVSLVVWRWHFGWVN